MRVPAAVPDPCPIRKEPWTISLHAGMFITVHLIFLLVLFSGGWSDRMTRPLSFLCALFIAADDRDRVEVADRIARLGAMADAVENLGE